MLTVYFNLNVLLLYHSDVCMRRRKIEAQGEHRHSFVLHSVSYYLSSTH